MRYIIVCSQCVPSIERNPQLRWTDRYMSSVAWFTSIKFINLHIITEQTKQRKRVKRREKSAYVECVVLWLRTAISHTISMHSYYISDIDYAIHNSICLFSVSNSGQSSDSAFDVKIILKRVPIIAWKLVEHENEQKVRQWRQNCWLGLNSVHLCWVVSPTRMR